MNSPALLPQPGPRLGLFRNARARSTAVLASLVLAAAPMSGCSECHRVDFDAADVLVIVAAAGIFAAAVFAGGSCDFSCPSDCPPRAPSYGHSSLNYDTCRGRDWRGNW